MEILEIEMEYMSNVITWLARKHKNIFQPAIAHPRTTTVSSRAATIGPHEGSIKNGVGPDKSCAMKPGTLS